eukprot:768787-Hanusia_phi.AAC.2
MSRRPPSDTYESAFASKEATPARAAAPYRNPANGQAPLQGPFQSFRSPFPHRADEAQGTRPAMAALVDFKEGIEIVEEAAPAPGARAVGAGPRVDFMDYNGAVSARPDPSSPYLNSSDDDEDNDMSSEVVVTKDDLRQMVNDNLRRNCGRGLRRGLASYPPPRHATLTAEALQAPLGGTADEAQDAYRSSLQEHLRKQGETIQSLRDDLDRKDPKPQTISSQLGAPASRVSRLTLGSLQV